MLFLPLPFFLSISRWAIALVIVTATYVAEPSPATALHLVAASRLLNPEVAFGALFEFLSADELHKVLIVLILLVSDLILFASLAPVIEHPAVEAVVLPA